MANENIWRLDTLLIAKETTAWTEWSTFVAIPLTSAPVLKPITEYNTNESGYWRIEWTAWACVTKSMSELSVEWNVYATPFWHLLNALFWQSASPTLVETWVYKHNFTLLNTNNHRSFSACTIWVDQKLSLYNMLDTLSINAEVGWIITFSWLFKGKAENSTTWKTAVFTQEECLRVANMTVKFASNIAWLSGATATKLTSLNLEFAKNVIDITENGSIEPTSFHNQNFTTSWSLEMVYRDDAFKDYNTAGTTRAMSVLIEWSSLIWATKKVELYFELPLLTFQEWDRSTDLNAITTQTVWFTWHLSLTDTKMASAYLQNTQSTAY